MKRKILFGVLALSLVLVAASCNKNNSAADSMQKGDSMQNTDNASGDPMNKPADSMDTGADGMDKTGADSMSSDKMDGQDSMKGDSMDGSKDKMDSGDSMAK